MYEMDDVDYDYQESMNQDFELEYRIESHILENKKLMEYIYHLEESQIEQEKKV